MTLRPTLFALIGLCLISAALPACSTLNAIPPPTETPAPPPPDIPPSLLTAEPEAFTAFTPREGRVVLDMETDVVRPLAEDRLRLVRDRALVRCILAAWRRDPWAAHKCARPERGEGASGNGR